MTKRVVVIFVTTAWVVLGCQPMTSTESGDLPRLATDQQPAVSPDGTKIAFSSDRDGNREIYVVNADGTGELHLTNGSLDSWYPAVPAEKDMVVFGRAREDGETAELWIMKSDGSAQRPLF